MRDMRYRGFKQRWICVLFGVYTGFTLLLWSHENYSFVSMPTVFSESNEALPVSTYLISADSSELAGNRLTTENQMRVSWNGPRTKCPFLVYPNEYVRNYWQKLSKFDIAFYAAFYDQSKSEIRVTAARDKRVGNPGLVCQVWGPDDSLQVSRATVMDLPEQKGKRYACSIFICKIRENFVPKYVSLSTQECQVSGKAMRIHRDEKWTGNFTVCVTPFNFNYSKAYELVEMIELNRILGASHFVFYNYSINSNVNSVLEHYIRLGFVEVLPWNLPMQVDTWPKKNPNIEIHYFAQIAALNDCLNRNRYKTKYIVYQDLDEFIIPRNVVTWNELFASLPTGKAAYMFRNTFFRKDWPDGNVTYTGIDLAKKFQAVTLLKQYREHKIFTRRHRSKYIVDPTKVEVLGIHTVQRFRVSSDFYVEPTMALMHHYRDWENPSDSKDKKYDPRIMTYKEQLLKSLNDTWSKLKGVHLGPLPF